MAKNNYNLSTIIAIQINLTSSGSLAGTLDVYPQGYKMY